MKVLLIIFAVIVVIIATIAFITYQITKSRRRDYADWKVGDVIHVIGVDQHFKLLGWSDDGFFIEKEGAVNKMDWSKLQYNKSVIWRRNWEGCKAAMGTEPGFAPGLGKSSNVGVSKPIDLLSETECEVYLKIALDKEDYTTAELIKQRLATKFR
jgi:hypothetical protein